MSDANKQGEAGSNPPEQPAVPVSTYEVVPAAQKASEADLYSFRAEIPPPPPPPPPTPTQVVLEKNRTLLLALAGGLAVVLIMAVIAWVVMRDDEPPAYIDLGTSNITGAGLQGRLVARWLGSAAYELRIDPISTTQLAGFSAVADDPPHPLSVTIRFKDASSIVCQKQILLPFNQQPLADPDHPTTVLPQKTFDGDTVQNVVSASGKIAEIIISGPLNCPVKDYKRLEGWDFSSNYPIIAEQGDWLRHLETVLVDEHHRVAEMRARALIPRSVPLAAPIEGDDVIVSDNPSRGSVQTSSGKTFYIGRDALLAAHGWQVFPVAIHFRCDTRSICTLTRSGAAAPLEARLVR
jgi:hypothetical protein